MTDESPKRPKETGVTSNAELRALIDEWRTWIEEKEEQQHGQTIATKEVEKCADDLEALLED